MNKREIAVIGMSGIYPQAENVTEFYQNLLVGKDCICKVPDERLELTKQDKDKNYMELGYLRHIDEFDYDFFNISYKEAAYMDPQQRLALQEACKTIWNSGYSLEEFRGTKTVVVLGCGESEYKSLTDEENGAIKIGNLKSVIAGRIAYQLDLKGLAYVLDTSCSSSLMAVHQACNHLMNEEADYALAGGVSLTVPLTENNIDKVNVLGIGSTSYRTKTFDADSDGTGGGEGCSFVLLKRLEDAIRDNDHIYAVIKGSSANQDGGSSNSVAAPSPSAQTEVILDAWKKAGVDPKTITYLEAHGTGTKIGDPIEVQGLTDAFAQYTAKKAFCEISAVKSNIGHTGYHAGIASFVKAVLAVYKKKKLPLVHFKKPNPMIHFEESAVTPCVKLSDWNDEIRRAGISSFGLSGTNVHVVIEQAPEKDMVKQEKYDCVPFVLSAQSEEQIMVYEKKFAEWLDTAEWSLFDIAYTQFIGREHYPYRKVYWVSSKTELKERLLHMEKPVYSKSKKEVVLLCSGDVAFSKELLVEWIASHKGTELSDYFVEQKELLENAKVRTVVGQVIAYTEWKQKGLPIKTIVGCGLGNLTVAYVLKKQSLEQMIDKALEYQEGTPLNQKAFLDAMDKLANTNVMFVELGQAGILSCLIKEKMMQASVICIGNDKEETIAKAIEQGLEFPWTSIAPEGNKVPIPPYSFQAKKCWMDMVVVKEETKEQKAEENEKEIKVPTIEMIRDIWKEVLGFKEFTDNEDFFEIGGNSLMAMQIIDRIVEEVNVELDFDDMYTYNTVMKLTHYVENLLPKQEEETESKVQKTEKVLSYQQEGMLILYKQNKQSTAYNMPAQVHLKGNVKKEALFGAMNAIVNKHDILRTAYREEQGVYQPYIIENAKLPILYEEVQEGQDSEQVCREKQEDMMQTVFDLEQDIPIKMQLLKIVEEEYMLFIVIHHIAADGWSVGIILNEFAQNYKLLCQGDEVTSKKAGMSYMQYAVKNRTLLESEAGKEKLHYWIETLKDIPDYLDFPTDKQRPDMMMNYGDNYIYTLNVEKKEKMEHFCKEQGITPFVFLYSLYSLLLYRFSGQHDYCIGTPVANRRGLQEEQIVGFFANSLAIHEKIDGTQTFLDYINDKKQQLTTALRNQDIPFDYIVKHLKINRTMSHMPVFQYGFVLQNLGNQLHLNDLEAEFLDFPVQYSKFEMLMSISLSEREFEVKMEYATELFEKETIRNFVTCFETLFMSCIEEPDHELDELSIFKLEENSSPVSFKETCDDYDF